MQFGTAAGLALSSAALLVAIKSKIDQRQLQEQLNRKAALEELAQDLSSLVNWIEQGLLLLENPTEWEDLRGQLRLLSNAVISHHHSTNEPVTIQYSFHVLKDGEREEIPHSERLLEIIRSNELPQIYLNIQGSEEMFEQPLSYPVGDFYRFGVHIFESVDEIEQKNGRVLKEFSPDLIDEVESATECLFGNTAASVLQNEGEIVINPDNYSDATEVWEQIYSELLFYDGIEEDIERLEDSIGELEETRKSLIRTSFS